MNCIANIVAVVSQTDKFNRLVYTILNLVEITMDKTNQGLVSTAHRKLVYFYFNGGTIN